MKSLAENYKNYKTLTAWIVSGRFPHAILIEGPAGTGKTSFGMEIARYVMCENENPPCGACPNCVKIEKNIHPDVIIAQGEGGVRSFHVDKVREIRQEAYVLPNEGRAKIFILRNAHEMTVQAQNALLKVIEEPPNNVYFVLTCENKNQMLTTIRSRCASLATSPVDTESVVMVLEQRLPGRTAEEYEAAASVAGGNIGAALGLMEHEGTDDSYQKAKAVWEAIKAHKELDMLLILSGYQRDKEGFILLLETLRMIIAKELIAAERKSGRGLSALRLAKIIDIIDETIPAAGGNVNMLLLVSLFPARVGRVISSR